MSPTSGTAYTWFCVTSSDWDTDSDLKTKADAATGALKDYGAIPLYAEGVKVGSLTTIASGDGEEEWDSMTLQFTEGIEPVAESNSEDAELINITFTLNGTSYSIALKQKEADSVKDAKWAFTTDTE